jgi:trk system potassium uptake protein TrkA
VAPGEEILMRVVIVGLGDVGRELVEMLTHERNHELVLIDQDEHRCEDMAAAHDALVLHGDATDPDILRQAELAVADALVATTGSDALNTVVAMLGRHFGVERTVVKLNEVGLEGACTEIGVSQIVTPKVSAAAEILDGLHGIDRIDLSSLALGGMRVFEVDGPEHTPVRVSEVGFPRGSLVLSVRRGSQVLFPHPDLELEVGDALLMIAENADVAERLRHGIGY